MTLTVGSLFSGCGGMDLGLERAGLRVVWQCEIEPRPASVLARHWPDVPNHGDVCEVATDDRPVQRVDVLCGGFPCQDVSVAGRRAWLAGERTGLFSEFVRIARRLRPRWVLLENVPGLFSSNCGRDFATVIGALVELGYGCAWRVLDSQHFGVPQRRRRVFIVGCAGADVRSAATVLFERESLPWDPAPGREAREGVAGSLAASTGGSDENDARDGRLIAGQCHGSSVGPPGTLRSGDNVTSGVPFVASSVVASAGHHGHSSPRGDGRDNLIVAPLTTKPHADNESQESKLVVAATLTGGGHANSSAPGRRREDDENLVYDERNVTSADNRSNPKPGDPSPTLHDSGSMMVARCLSTRNERIDAETETLIPSVVNLRGRDGGSMPECDHLASIRASSGGSSRSYIQESGVRRLMPLECERLQGFPDDWTRWDASGTELADGPRYAMIGNAVSVPVAEWIGQRIIAASEGGAA